ncbi:MAG: hypothetical protein G01um101438_529 [Parcubacteria group bacterium Gr01-1014_38]|nr:MAG: hypothetical protein G01um101438_529 [Parcubacteria group bacterium Gr01-1014_38]
MRIALTLVALTLFPGVPLAVVLLRSVRDGLSWLSVAGVLGLLWSAAATVGLTMLHVPLSPPSVLAINLIPALVLLTRRSTRRSAVGAIRTLSFPPTTVFLVLLVVGVLLLPFLTVHRGLPTGDVQKAIFWGTEILESARLPDYAEATRFNRDPADFATPALHTLTAAAMRLSGDPLRGPTWLAFLSGLFLAGLAAAFGSLLDYHHRLSLLPPLAFLLAAANARALRYTAAPGYHYQNLFGELFLLISFFALLHAIGGRGNQRVVLLTAAAAGLLPFVHQFSAFFAMLLLPTIFLILLLKYRGEVASLLVNRFAKRRSLLAAGALLAAALVATLLTNMAPSVFSRLVTPAPHLRASLILPSSIPELLGLPFVLLGIAGIIIAIVRLRRQDLEWRWSLLLIWIFLLAALSQGPRWFLDIPSARTLFYIVTPLAVLAALAVARAVEQIRTLWPRAASLLIPVALALALAPTVGVPLNAGLQGLDQPTSGTSVLTDQTHPHNATLTPAMRELLSFLTEHPPACEASRASCRDAILVDDWGQRRSTWALLSPYRMVMRVGADIAVSAGEAHQSAQRRQQYETLLDFEKVFSLGTSPLIRPLLERHGISLLLGKNGSSADVFRRNPLLEPIFQTSEATLFRAKMDVAVQRMPVDAPDADFLLAPTTLVNDIGDAEDAAPHLPLPLFAPNSSHPLNISEQTIREIRSQESRIGINVGRFVPEFWDADRNRVVDRPLHLLLRALSNGARGRLLVENTVIATFALPTTGELRSIRVTVPERLLRFNTSGEAFLTLALDRGPLRLDLLAVGPPH